VTTIGIVIIALLFFILLTVSSATRALVRDLGKVVAAVLLFGFIIFLASVFQPVIMHMFG
jgi:hypothetical protein